MGNTELHSEYKGNVIERYKQKENDAEQMMQDIEEKQKGLLEAERKRIEEKNAEEGIEIEDPMKDYAKDDRYNEYLVDGAVLSCTQATCNDFYVSDETTINLSLDMDETEEERKRTILHVYENPIYIKDMKYATVRNTSMYQNVKPFRCNCALPADREEERQRILADDKCCQHGVCRHLMELNDTWDNVVFEGTDYLKIRRALAGGVAVFSPADSLTVEEDGIIMTSILFCRHGGIIYPETSGQDNELIGSFDCLSDEEILFVTTIYGEADACSEYSWQAIANVIINRIGIREWKENTTVSEVIMNTGFDAYTYPNVPFREAQKYFEDRNYTNAKIEEMIRVVIPVYRGNVEDITDGAVLYYSPEALKNLHEKYPKKYPNEKPDWDFSQLEKVEMEGIEDDDFLFYRYK